MMKLESLMILAAVAAACLYRKRPVRAANEELHDDESAFANAPGGQAVFEIAQGDSFFVPFGEYPHKQGLQIFDRTAAEGIVASHNSLPSRFKRFVTGANSYPVYVGHPDLPGSKDADKRAYGWIESMAVENDGLRLGVKWSEEGQKMVANAHFKYYSPYWWMKKDGKGFRPSSLISMGLTNQPNIPVPALANESAAEDSETLAGGCVRDVLGLANEADELEVFHAVQAIADRAATAEAANATLVLERDTARGELTAANASVATLTTERDTAAGALTAANEALDALRGAMIDRVLESAVAKGQVLPAEKAGKREELLAANDLTASLAEVEALAPKLKTKSVTGDLGGAKVTVITAHNDEDKAARDARKQAVANELAQIPAGRPENERRQIAWQRAQAKNPDLFSKSPVPAA